MRLFAGILLLTALSPIACEGASIKLLSHLFPGPGSSEIISYTGDGNHLACAMSGEAGHAILIFTLDSKGSLTEKHKVLLETFFNGDIFSVSSVALDPLGRGLGAATVIPTDKAHTKGRLVFFNYRTGELLGEGLETGFHPDCVNFSKEGRFLVVADEGEFNDKASTPGSLSVVDLSLLADTTWEEVGRLKLSNHDFTTCDLKGLRVNETGIPAHEAMEPEYVTAIGTRAYVTLQENNAIAEFDLEKRRWRVVHNLGTTVETIDANDKDGKADISHPVAGMPMPDTITAFEQSGRIILATANEGDARGDDADKVKVGKAKLDASLSHLASEGQIGRLEISAIDGDTDGDGDIDIPTMFGTRSMSLWDAATGQRIADTGSLEPILFQQAPELHNIEEGDPSSFDKRSNKKGPEPEALATGLIEDKRFVFVGLERQNGIVMFDVTEAANPKFAAYVNTITEKLVAPESLVFVPAKSSPTGGPLLLGGYEMNQGGIAVFQITP